MLVHIFGAKLQFKFEKSKHLTIIFLNFSQTTLLFLTFANGKELGF